MPGHFFSFAKFFRDMSAMSSRRVKSKKAAENLIKSEDPKDLERRIFVGNLPTDKMSRHDFETQFSKYGAITG